jgi:hypothetical protein
VGGGGGFILESGAKFVNLKVTSRGPKYPTTV